jgi:hypothetical protein
LNILDAIERRLAKVPRITLRQTLVLKVAFRRSVSINPPVFFCSCRKPNRHNTLGILSGSITSVRGGAASEADAGQII